MKIKRWASRLVQIQNLPKNFLPTLGLARDFVKAGKKDMVELVYGNVPDTLSQLIRTAFIPSDGKVLIVCDFSAIEARVLSWLAGEKWRNDVFSTHGKIYEASASAMFGVPLDTIVKGHDNYKFRAYGKVSELGLGYQGSVGALIAMGALDMGVKESELQSLVDMWRGANPRIVKYWYSLQAMVLKCLQEGISGTVGGVRADKVADIGEKLCFLNLGLPSGRKLYYSTPHTSVNKWGGASIGYWGQDQTTKKWTKQETYGGKLAENCLGGDTKVLTDRGWVLITSVDLADRLWDGVEWVRHGGVISKGRQYTIKVDGVGMTPDHLVLTERGWKSASQSKGFDRAKVQLPNCYKIRGFRRKKIFVGSGVYLRDTKSTELFGFQEEKTKILRVYAKGFNSQRYTNTWHDRTQSLCGMAKHGRPLPTAYTPSVGELRGSGNKSLRKMEGVHKFLGGYEPRICGGANTRTPRCKWGLRDSELHLGDIQTASKQQKKQPFSNYRMWNYDTKRTEWVIGGGLFNSLVPTLGRLPDGEDIGSARCSEQVYDIMDCGIRNRFVVLGGTGAFIVHNCTQAVSRDCLAIAVERLTLAGFNIVAHVHDEVIIEGVAGDLAEVKRIMELPIDWAKGLILKAEGFEGAYYKKE